MKQPTKLTRRQKSIVAKSGFYPTDNWFCVQETKEGLTIINRVTQKLEFIPYKS